MAAEISEMLRLFIRLDGPGMIYRGDVDRNLRDIMRLGIELKEYLSSPMPMIKVSEP